MPNPPIRRKKFDIYEFLAGCLNQSLISQSVGFKCQIIYAKKKCNIASGILENNPFLQPSLIVKYMAVIVFMKIMTFWNEYKLFSRMALKLINIRCIETGSDNL